MLPVVVARSPSDGVAIRYVLSVLWMTSCFRAMGQMGQNRARRYVQVAVPVGRQATAVFG